MSLSSLAHCPHFVHHALHHAAPSLHAEEQMGRGIWEGKLVDGGKVVMQTLVCPKLACRGWG